MHFDGDTQNYTYVIFKDARDVQFNEALITLVANQLRFLWTQWLRRNEFY